MGLTRKTTTISQAAALLQNAGSVALFAHTNPDGDAVGSCVALKLMLLQLCKRVEVFCDSDLSNRLASFEQTQSISKDYFGKYDLLVAVDCSDSSRVGQLEPIFVSARETLTVDHHGGEYFSKYNCVRNYASCCQIVYEIGKELDVKLDCEIATYLYMGLCTDTGNFAHNNTDVDCFRMAGNLLACGADIERVYRAFFRDTTLAETKLLARALSRIRSYYDEKMFLTYVTAKDLSEFGVSHTTTSGIVPFLIDIDTAKLGVCICEVTPNHYRVSMRGKDFSARDVCAEFGGGGHVLAAGCRIDGFLEDVIEKIVRVAGYTI